MTTAALLSDTRHNADGVVGYEGCDSTGFLPAQNGIHWMGDAGISASLDDMLAWEVFIDATRDDPLGLYNRLSAPPRFAFGSAAAYGNGLRHDTVAGVSATGHGGALRGFRTRRMHIASKRLSVVVMFNHGGNAHAATVALLEAALGFQPDTPAPCPPDWAGLWLDDRHGLLLRLTPGPDGLAFDYGSASATLVAGPEGTAQGDGITLRRLGDDLWMQRAEENLTLTARKLVAVEQADGAAIAGTYWSDEVGATVEITARDGAVFAGFDGLLGRGPVERMYPVAADIWVITTRRAMDAPAPGDWTVQVRRTGGAVTGLVIGCWLARGIAYQRRG